MNKAVSSCEGTTLDDFTESNTTGRFRRSAKGLDQFGNPKQYIWGYYVTEPVGLVKHPPDGKKNFLSLLQDARINDHYSVARGLPEVVDLTAAIAEQSSAKPKSMPRKQHMKRQRGPNMVAFQGNILRRCIGIVPTPRSSFLVIQMIVAVLLSIFWRNESIDCSRPIGQSMGGKIKTTSALLTTYFHKAEVFDSLLSLYVCP